MGTSEIAANWQGNKPLGGSEVLAMDKPGSYQFILTCFNAAGTAVSQTVTVVVEQEGCVCLPVDGNVLMGGNPPGEKQIERLTLSLAGQPVAVLVSGDVSERNGTYYFMGDHLGSSNVLVDKSDNSIVPGSRTFYQPFGGYRGDLPDQGLTDQGFTGHKHNNDLGLVYMNARYYLPGIGRFASADTLVPDPENPQQYNRYSYTLNNPVKFTDPTGHCVAELPCPDFVQNGVDYLTNYQSNNLSERDNNWPEWTYSRLFPDYGTVQGSFPGIGFISFALTIDDYSNVSFAVGGNLSLPDTLTGSVQFSGGWLTGEQVVIAEKGTVGVEWQHRLGVENSPSETDLERLSSDWSWGVGGGFIAGMDMVGTLTTDPWLVGTQTGLYSPQIGGGISYSWQIYDAGSDTPWIWQN